MNLNLCNHIIILFVMSEKEQIKILPECMSEVLGRYNDIFRAWIRKFQRAQKRGDCKLNMNQDTLSTIEQIKKTDY